MSLSRAVHLFKACYGKTMIQYALEIRLNAALERMKYSSMTLEQIAETCGFASYSYFHRVFRARYGVSPAQYRAAEGGVK
ncbi:helix-turn-helix transcriptional regulator [Paenibacillus sp. P25]|nr:helix-turn-helix transcriptional regulator [Paenibacillus sp. P25]